MYSDSRGQLFEKVLAARLAGLSITNVAAVKHKMLDMQTCYLIDPTDGSVGRATNH